MVELDPLVVQVAEAYFGFEQGDLSTTRAVIVDGLEVCAKDGKATRTELALLEPQSLSFLVIGVDSKDKTVGMPCPLAAFCTVDYLQTLKSLLKPQGSVLAINISA
jgi:spermidine synthase